MVYTALLDLCTNLLICTIARAYLGDLLELVKLLQEATYLLALSKVHLLLRLQVLLDTLEMLERRVELHDESKI